MHKCHPLPESNVLLTACKKKMKSNDYKLCSIVSFMLQVVYFDERKYFQQWYVWISLPWKQTY